MNDSDVVLLTNDVAIYFTLTGC